MALVTFNTVPDRGTPGQMTLHTAQLVAHATVAADAHFVDPANWDKVICFYRSTLSGQKESAIFDADGITDPTTNFSVSATSVGDFEVQYLAIKDYDGGLLQVERGALSTAEFDVILIQTFLSAKSMKFLTGSRFGVPVAGGSDQHTLSLWYKYDTTANITKEAVNTIAGFTGALQLAYDNLGNLGLRNVSGSTWVVTPTPAKAQVADGNWYHILISKTSGSTPYKIYVNGVLDSTSSNGSLTASTLYIGSFTGAATEAPKGHIAQVDVYDINFLDAEVLTHYQADGTAITDPEQSVHSNRLIHSYRMGDSEGVGEDTASRIYDIITETQSADAVIGPVVIEPISPV